MAINSVKINGSTTSYVVNSGPNNSYALSGSGFPSNPAPNWSSGGYGAISQVLVSQSSTSEIDGSFTFTPPQSLLGVYSTNGTISVTVGTSTFGPKPCVYPAPPPPPPAPAPSKL